MKETIRIVCIIVLISAMMIMPTAAAFEPGECDLNVYPGGDIQAAIDSASDGDTICVHAGIYSGSSIYIDKPNITLKGEGADVVTYGGGSIVVGKFSDVQGCIVEGFTVINSHWGICTVNYPNVTIRNNVIVDPIYSVQLVAEHTTFVNNVVLNGSNEYSAVWVLGDSCTIVNNTIRDSVGAAITVEDSSNSILAKNNLILNDYAGIELYYAGEGNRIYLNNFIDNGVTVTTSGEPAPAVTYWNSTEPIEYTYNPTCTNYLGNYWGSDYTGTDSDGDGIGDDPYPIPEISGDYDYHPLVDPFENYPAPGPDPLEFGDAPDPNYPSLLASNGARHTPTDTECLGLAVTGTDWKDFEPDARVVNLDIPFDDGLQTFVLTTENITQTVDFEVSNLIPDDSTLIVNILLDLNGDGDWSDTIGAQSEHVVQNQPINLVGPAEDTFISTAFSTVGATGGQTWMRITLTRHQINAGWDGTMASAGYTEPFECGETEDWLVELQVPPNATVFFVPEDIRLPKYCDTTNVSIWIDTEEVITSGRMEFDYADCCMNVTGYEMNTTNWVPGSSDMVLTSGKVRTTLLAPGSGVGPGLLHVGNITVHCCNDTGYCMTDVVWNKTGGAPGFYLWNDASAMLDFIDWQDGTFRCNIPDLVITAVKGNEISGTLYNVSYTVKNIGEVDASPCCVGLLVDGSQVETMFVPALAPGAEFADSFVKEIELTDTVDSLLVCADYDGEVVELDETNNCMIGRYPGEVVIKVQPAVTYVQPQDPFDVKIYVDTKGIDVYAVQYRLTYDTSIVRAETQNKDTFLGSISETMVVVNEISQPYGEVAYAETRKVPGAVTESDNVTNIHFIAIGVRGDTTPLTLDDIIISDEDGVAIAHTIEYGEVVITENTAPVPIGVSKHRINNVAQKYQSTAILCSCSYDPDYPGKGGNITYIRWAFGDGQYGTTEGLPVDNCTCNEHKYESWQWDPLGDQNGDYVPFDVQLDVMDDGCPELNNATNFTIDVYIAGDANGDGEVNILDAVWVGKHWRETCSGDLSNPIPAYCGDCNGYLWGAEAQKDGADLNNDCEVNILDAVIVGANWRHVAW